MLLFPDHIHASFNDLFGRLLIGEIETCGKIIHGFDDIICTDCCASQAQSRPANRLVSARRWEMKMRVINTSRQFFDCYARGMQSVSGSAVHKIKRVSQAYQQHQRGMYKQFYYRGKNVVNQTNIEELCFYNSHAPSLITVEYRPETQAKPF